MQIQLEPIYRGIIRSLVRVFYKTTFIGFNKIPKSGPVVLIANHVSYVDGVMIQAACGRPVRYIIDEYIYNMPLVHYFMKLNRAIPILPKKESVKAALDTVSQGLEQGDIICIFPEGQLTYTGNLGRFKPGVEWIVERDPVPVYPVAIRGLWGSVFSRKYLRSKYRFIPERLYRRVTVMCGDPIQPRDLDINYLHRVILSLKNSI